MLYLYINKLIRAATGKQYGIFTMKTLNFNLTPDRLFFTIVAIVMIIAIVVIKNANVINLM